MGFLFSNKGPKVEQPKDAKPVCWPRLEIGPFFILSLTQNERGPAMTKEQKRSFVEIIVDNLKASLLRKMEIQELPEKWAGKELRQWASDYFHANYVFRLTLKERRRYNNEIAVKNLI
jgi:hypothetical protein